MITCEMNRDGTNLRSDSVTFFNTLQSVTLNLGDATVNFFVERYTCHICSINFEKKRVLFVKYFKQKQFNIQTFKKNFAARHKTTNRNAERPC